MNGDNILTENITEDYKISKRMYFTREILLQSETLYELSCTILNQICILRRSIFKKNQEKRWDNGNIYEITNIVIYD